MKSIESLGGPMICLPLSIAHLWSANTGKVFIGEASEFSTDYDASYLGIGQSLEQPISIAALRGVIGAALVFAMPHETQIVLSDHDFVCLGQVIITEDKDPLSSIGQQEIDSIKYDEEIVFYNPDTTPFCLFDAAQTIDEVGQERLDFQLNAGTYALSAGTYQSTRTTALLYRLARR